LVRNGRAQKIGLPILFFSEDEKLLLTGNVAQGRLNLPSTSYDVRSSSQGVNLPKIVRKFGDFLFYDATTITEIGYTGLLRQKPINPAVIVPMTVRVNDASTSPYLEPSANWQVHAVGNPDRVWVSPTQVQEVLTGGQLSDNTATIVRFATRDM
jgi:hypothetical protein